MAVPLHFGLLNDASVSHFLSAPTEVDLYSVMLATGEDIELTISAQQSGSPLVSLLRVFGPDGTPLALDNQQGGDPYLDFQASTAGTYFIGVSASPNNDYNPLVPGSGVAGGTTGLYKLSARVTTPALFPDLAGASFRTGLDMAQAGESVPVSFTVENRGGGDPGIFSVQVLLSATNDFGTTARVLANLSRSQLTESATGRDFTSPAGFSVTVPAGWASGQAVVGLRIVAAPNVPETDLDDKSGVHRGSDWEPITIVTANSANATDLSTVDPNISTESTAALTAAIPVSVYSFTVSSTLGDGQFEAEINADGSSLAARLTLSGQTGAVIVQSDSGQIIESLVPGTYLLSVSRISGSGSDRLTTSFIQTANPFAPLPGGAGTATVATGDLNGDGYPDVVIGNRVDDTVTVYMNLGDGNFELPQTYAVGARVWKVTVADATGNGRLDVLSANKGANTVSLLLNNGDGTFAPQIVIPTGSRPGGVTVADLNGDGIPDLVVDNYASDNVGVYMGEGDGKFAPPVTYSSSKGSAFAGPTPVTVADLTGDGIPDLIIPNYVAANVAIRLGYGNGTFGPATTFPTQYGAYAAAVVDLNGDGKPDLLVANSVANSVSVLLGNGNGTFQPQSVYSVGFDPYGMAVAQLTGDGNWDVVTANRGANTDSVLLGNGNGTFQPEPAYPSGSAPRGIAVGDFNGDGDVDIVNTNQGDDTATLLWNNGDGTFTSDEGQTAPAPTLRPFQVVVADLTKNGLPDIITADRSDNSVSVLLANSDGSFQTRETYPTGRLPISIAVGDLTGDGIDDIVTANYGGDQVSVLFGNGDGTFQPFHDIQAGSDTYDVKLADLTGDGRLDIVVTNKNDNTVGVILNEGGGKFAPMVAYPVASGPYEVAVDDLLGNGIPDLVVSHFSATVVDVLFGNGNGTFQPAIELPAGSRPYGLALADLTGDGLPDIVTSDYRDNEVSVLLNEGKGHFAAPEIYQVGKGPNEVQVADLTGDGIDDIVAANYGSDSVSVLLGNGKGTFGPAQSFAAGNGPASLYVADLNGDRIPDVVVASRNGNSVGLLFGNGNGTFEAPVIMGGGPKTYSAASADLTGDGNLDIVTTNINQNTVTVHLGNGDGSFAAGATTLVGLAPTAVAVADLNGDGRPDIVTANSESNTVSVLLGNGDGTFSALQTFAVGDSPRAVAIADLTGDGIRDLIVANYNAGTISVLIGKGDGTFYPQEKFFVGARPYAIAVADLNGDGRPDIIVANAASDTVSVLMNLGGTADQVKLGPDVMFATGRDPVAVAVGDVTGDGKPDIVTANAYDGTISVLLGNGNGTFQSQQTYAVGSRPYSVALADLTGDGRLDIVTTDYGNDSVSVLLNQGRGAFAPPQTWATGQEPIATLVGDFNGDGLPDLATIDNHDSTIGVLLGQGNGTFEPAPAGSGVGLNDTPLYGDFSGDGVGDTVVLDQSGNILFRAGLPGSTNAFAPPVILNPGRPARAINEVLLGSRLAIVAADAHYDSALSTSAGHFVFTVSLYTVGPNGQVTRIVAFAAADLPTSLATAQLTGNGLFDLIAANALADTVTIALQTAPGVFAAPLSVPAGDAPSAITTGIFTGDGLTDIAVTDQASGEVTVLLNDPNHDFSQSLKFQANTSIHGVASTLSGPSATSFVQSVSLAAGDFTGPGSEDLVVLDQATHSFTLMVGDGSGGFFSPGQGLTTSTSDGFSVNDRPIAIVSGDFKKGGSTDLAVLMEDTGEIWIYTNNSNGTFQHTFSIPVGEEATGLTVVKGNGQGLFNLLVGNRFGDVLILVGRGDGTFQIAGSRVSISVVPDLLGPGQAGVLVGDQKNDRVTVQAPSANGNQYTPVATLGSTSSASQELAPGDVQWAYLDQGASFPDAIVVGTGSNSVEVYRTISITDGVPTFAPSPEVYFVGTAPVSVTVADLTGAGVPSLLVANQGSNDVSEIFGTYNASGDWKGTLGPRLKSGGDGPIAVIVAELTGNSILDLAIVNGGSGTVTMLPGVGGGFFNDQDPTVLFNLGNAVVQPPTFTGTSGVGYAVTAVGNLVRFDLDDPAAGASVVYSGQQVVAAQALASGQVVAALANGVVDLLVPQGRGLAVFSQLQASGGTPSLPSSIDVVAQANGLFDVLVSSEGSDNLSVFSFGGAIVTGGLTTSPGGATLPTLNNLQSPGANPGQPSLLSSSVIATSASATAASASTSASTSSGALSVSATSSVGLSLGGFSSLKGSSSSGNEEALLVSVEGNTYLSVPVLGFGAENDEVGNGEERMPWLAAEHPVGDASPLSRFLIGLDEALRNYRGANGAALPRTIGRSDEMWNEDLFFRHLPVHPKVVNPEQESSKSGTAPQAMGPDPRDDHRPGHPRFAGKPLDLSREQTHQTDSWIVVGSKAVAGLLTALFLTPTIFRYISPERHQQGAENPARAKRVNSRRARPHSCEPH
jgi:FG-GAP-like repeat/Bacterial pre-peptidase C-terminal domain/FG-GAP repeat